MSPEDSIISVLANSKEAFTGMINVFRAMERTEQEKTYKVAEASLFNPELIGAAQRQKGRQEMLGDLVLYFESFQKK